MKTQAQMMREWERLFQLCHNPVPNEVTVGAVIMPTGDWLERAKPALALFKSRFESQERKPYLVVTGRHSHPDLLGGGASADKVVRAMRILGKLTPEMKENLLVEAEADNTKEQVDNTYKLLQDGVIVDPLVVVVSDYHLPRFYSTFLATILRNEGSPRIRVYSVPVCGNWESIKNPEPRPASRTARILAEMERTRRYREKGDVATEEELLKYVRWLRSQHEPR